MGVLKALGGVLLVILGFFLTLTIIGAIIGIPLIYKGLKWMGRSQEDIIAKGVAKGIAQAKEQEKAAARRA